HIALGYTAFPSAELNTDEVALSITRHPIELEVGWRMGGAFRFGVDLGARVDVITRVTQLGSVDWVPATPTVHALFSAGARAVGALKVGPWAELFISVGAEALFNRFDFVIDLPSGMSQPLVTPWGWRAVARAGAHVALF